MGMLPVKGCGQETEATATGERLVWLGRAPATSSPPNRARGYSDVVLRQAGAEAGRREARAAIGAP
jgi:hypothetical protein